MTQNEDIHFTGGEVWRKAIHLLVLIVPIALFVLGRRLSLVFLIVISVVAVVCDIWRARSERFSGLIDRVFGFMMRGAEKPEPGGRVVLNGATWILLSMLILISIFPFSLALIAFAVFVAADAAAAAVGMTLGRRRWPGSNSTYIGSAAFFLICLIILIPFTDYPPLVATLAAATGTVVEALFPWPNDNVSAPLSIAVVLWTASHFF